MPLPVPYRDITVYLPYDGTESVWARWANCKSLLPKQYRSCTVYRHPSTVTVLHNTAADTVTVPICYLHVYWVGNFTYQLSEDTDFE